jgi:hypothetical protein
MAEKFIDRPYLVYQEFTIPAGQYRYGQPVEIKNPNSEFVLLGVTALQDGSGVAKVLIRDAAGRAIASDTIFVQSVGTALGGGAIPVGDQGFLFPRNASVQVDGQEVNNADPITVHMLHWGYLRAGVEECE